MCGIVGYIGPKEVVPVVIEGLRKLEYRGYDSAGIAVVNDGKLEVRRAPGKLRNLEETLKKSPIEGTYGIGHTRWATHGRPTEENAHPHRDCSGEIVVVHNGIIENYLELREQLQREGHKFVTETDTEIVAHLVEKNAKGGVPLEEAVRKSLNQLRGIYALVFMSACDPHKIVAARMGPPAVIGLGENEFFVASDIPALLEHTRNIFFLNDGDIAVLTKSGVHVMDHNGKPVERKPHHVAWDPIMAEKGGYKHFMQKEIFEQPRAVRDTLLGSISRDTGKTYLAEFGLTNAQFPPSDLHYGEARGQLTGHAPKALLQEFTRIPHKMETILQAEESGFYENLARQFFRCTDFLYLGRGIHYPIALEGALKLKEISYIHAEGYPAGEMKHGPNALIDENLPVVVLATHDKNDPDSVTRYDKSVSNIQELRARDGIVISVVTAGDHLAREASNHVIEIPPAPELLSPLLEIIPLQLLAYHIAVRRGCDVDQPRNLAKSVTVE